MIFIAALAGALAAEQVSYTGTVVDSASSQAIQGATVTLLEYPAIDTTTGTDGTFNLFGTTPAAGAESALPTRGAGAAFSARITNNALFVGGFAHDAEVAIDVFTSAGVRIARRKLQASGGGQTIIKGLWRHPGLYIVFVESQGIRIRLTGMITLGLSTKQAYPGKNDRRSASLAKTQAAYTLRIAKPGYVTKDVAMSSATGDAGTIRLAASQVQTGVWVNVTPAGLASGDITGFGPGSIVGDPARPSDLYFGGSASGLWKSTDYGLSWAKINNSTPDIARGCVIAVAGTTPATIWVAGHLVMYKSTNGGASFTTYPVPEDFYSLTIDPYDNNHLISGLHELAGVYESTDGGVTWRSAGSGSIGGGISVYPFFIDMGNAAATRTTWFAIAQNGSSPGRTTNSGATWTMPAGLSNIQHPHGNAQIFQRGANVWVGGAWDWRGAIYRSTDYGATFTRVTTDDKPQAVVWGTDKNVYAMYAWACSKCDLNPNFEIAPLPNGTSWTYVENPGPKIGPNTVAVTNDGTHNIFVGIMWAEGIWRYVEP